MSRCRQAAGAEIVEDTEKSEYHSHLDEFQGHIEAFQATVRDHIDTLLPFAQ